MLENVLSSRPSPAGTVLDGLALLAGACGCVILVEIHRFATIQEHLCPS
jgi:hypothetical protein